jgi:16S rRNA (adenine1518-N6/adenine1519-N6)-dimethyltransferase
MKSRPIKKLGQHFLIDKNIIKKIVKEFSPAENDFVVEIGPGKGALTKELLSHTKNLIVVEIDSNLAQELQNIFPEIKIINKDILECDFGKDFFTEKFRVIGNLPYYITSQILFKIYESHSTVKDAMIMIQKEVAERIVSKPKTKEYGILSVFSQYYSEPKILFNISRNVFYPKPEVDSSIVHLKMKEETWLNPEIEEAFRKLVRTAFNQRRKTLKNSLKNLFDEHQNELSEKFFSLQFDFSRRAEELSLDDFIYLAKNFYQILH